MEQDKARLGDAIRRAREGMSPPLTRKQFAALVHMDDRRIGDFERGSWDGVRPANRDAIERALGWEHGSWDAVLAGGDPKPVERRETRRSDETPNLVYVLRHARDVSPETLETLRVIIEEDRKRER
jgi:hypothetical protein